MTVCDEFRVVETSNSRGGYLDGYLLIGERLDVRLPDGTIINVSVGVDLHSGGEIPNSVHGIFDFHGVLARISLIGRYARRTL
jgi:hypothetical protein